MLSERRSDASGASFVFERERTLLRERRDALCQLVASWLHLATFVAMPGATVVASCSVRSIAQSHGVLSYPDSFRLDLFPTREPHQKAPYRMADGDTSVFELMPEMTMGDFKEMLKAELSSSREACLDRN